MNIIPTSIPDVLLIESKVIMDARGFFLETYREETLAEAGIPHHFVQENHSGSARGVLRGLHYQIRQPQGKLVSAVRGEIFDVAVDIRRSSPTFGQWAGVILSEKKHFQLWIPPGFAHGFFVLSEWAELIYKATDYYAPRWERSIIWHDPDLGIEWPINDEDQPIVSSKDAAGKMFRDAEVYSE
jgi:dTDP-4-dehydrorhamnose 3,5-epimerase